MRQVCYFVAKNGYSFQILGIKKIKVENLKVSFKKKEYGVDKSKPSLISRRESIFIIDVNAGQLELDMSTPVMNNELLDLICNQSIISQLVKLTIGKIDWFQVILGIACGVGVGLFIGGQFF